MRTTKAYRVTLLVIDHDDIGADDVHQVIEGQRFPNDCIRPKVLTTEVSDIGVWYDRHPLNLRSTTLSEIGSYFKGAPTAGKVPR